MRPISFGPPQPLPRPVRFGNMENIYGPKPKLTEAKLKQVEQFLKQIAEGPALKDNQLRGKVAGLIGPTFLPADYHQEYQALQKIASEKDTYPQLAPIAQRAIDLYNKRGDDTFGFAD